MVSGIFRERPLVQPWLPPGERTNLAFHRGAGACSAPSPSGPIVLTSGSVDSLPWPGGAPAEARRGVSLAARERLCIVLLSGSFERIHYALCMASPAAALGRPVTLFVTLGALRALVAAEMGPTTRLDEPARRPQHRRLRTEPRWMPATGHAAWSASKNCCRPAPPSGPVHGLEMGLRTLGLTSGALRSHVKLEPGGLATLFARGGQIVVL
jgi:hypothetical protein